MYFFIFSFAGVGSSISAPKAQGDFDRAFDKIICFATNEVDKRRRSTEAAGNSPRNGHVSTTTGNLKASSSIDYNERPKTPSANGETSPDSGICDLPLPSDHWNHSGDMDSYSSKARRNRENSAYMSRRSPTPPPMGIPRTPSPSRIDDPCYADDLDEPPRISTPPTPGRNVDFKKLQQQSKLDKDTGDNNASYRPQHSQPLPEQLPMNDLKTDKMDLDNSRSATTTEKTESSATSESTPNNNSTIAGVPPPASSHPSNSSSSGDQQHPKKRWNHWSHNSGPQQPSARASSPHTGSVDGRSSVASDCSSTADSIANHLPPVATGNSGNFNLNSSTPAPATTSNPGVQPSYATSAANAGRFRPKGKGIDWNTERSSPYGSASCSPNTFQPQQTSHSNPYPTTQNQQSNHAPPPNVQVIPSGGVPHVPLHHQHNHHTPPSGMNANANPQPKQSSVPLPIGRIPPPPPPPHTGKSILSAVDQVIMQTLNSGNRPNNSPSYENKEFPQTYNNNLYKQGSISASSNYNNATNHSHFNTGSSPQQKMSVSSSYQQQPGPHNNNYHHSQQSAHIYPVPQPQQQQHSSPQTQMYGNVQHHVTPSAGAGIRQQHSTNAYPVMQSPKIHPSAYATSSHGGGSTNSISGSQQHGNSYYNYNNGGASSHHNTGHGQQQQQQHMVGNKASPYESRNGYHRQPQQQSSAYQSYGVGPGAQSHHPGGKGVQQEMYSQQQHYNNSHYSRPQQAQPHHHLNSSSAHHNPHGLPQQGPNHPQLPTRR